MNKDNANILIINDDPALKEGACGERVDHKPVFLVRCGEVHIDYVTMPDNKNSRNIISMEHNPKRTSHKKSLTCIFVFILSFISIMLTIDDYGLTWDEPHYVIHSQRISEWFGKLVNFEAPFSDENFRKYWNYDRFHNCHPPFYKLSGIVFKNLIGRFFFDNVVYQYRTSTAVWASVFLVVFSLYFCRVYGNYVVGVLASCVFLLVPRFFAHMHFFATDMIVATLGFITLYISYYQAGKIRYVLLSSIFAGALLATKFTGVLIFPIVFFFVFASRNKKRSLVHYLIFTSLSFTVFLIFNPHAWFGIVDEVLFYLRSALERESVVPILTLYFGEAYDFRLPWHHPFVMFGITLPLLIVIFAVVGITHNLIRRKDETVFFELVPFILLFAVLVLPQAPKHDGIRLFSMVWPFIIILFVRGIYAFSDYFAILLYRCRVNIHKFAMGFVRLPITIMVVLIILNLGLVYAYHPYELSYYNEFIGGSQGAAQRGFDISYWGEALNGDALNKVSSLFEDRTDKVYTYPNEKALYWNRLFGFLDGDINSVNNIEEADCVLALNRCLAPDLHDYVRQNMEYPIIRLRDNTLVLGIVNDWQQNLRWPAPSFDIRSNTMQN
jgi:4-amino-4-deoxy-L-arabinose transferase-like glycosyltransferase